MDDKMSALKSAGRLTIGVSPFRCMYLMPKIVKAIRNKFPHVQIVLHEDDSAALRRDMADGKFDLAILNLPVDESILDAVPIESEALVLAVPNVMTKSLPTGKNGEIDLADCKELPFVVVGETQELRQRQLGIGRWAIWGFGHAIGLDHVRIPVRTPAQLGRSARHPGVGTAGGGWVVQIGRERWGTGVDKLL
jgi:DNA-binding transcriptional LysR family regulator